MSSFFFLLLASALSSSHGSVLQNVASGSSQLIAPADEIVVTGRRLPELAEVKRFVRSVATPVGDQMALFRRAICPNVLGLDPNDAAKVVTRMRLVAKSARIQMASEPCFPNLTLIIAADGRAFMKEVVRTRGNTLDALNPVQRGALLNSPGPAWAWRTIAKKTAEGKINAVSDPALLIGGGTMGGSMTGMQTREGSILKLQVRQDVADSYVVIDEKAVDGKSLLQLADYTVMRAVAGATPSPEAAASGSILSLFDTGAAPPLSLSYLDLAFLMTVYELPMNKKFNSQLTLIASRISNADTAKKANTKLQEEDR